MNYKLLNKTKSLCPICLKKINANVGIKKNKVIIFKECSVHGKFESFHVWDDPFLYKEFMKISKKKREYVKDATLDLTSRCNMNCSFCFSTLKNKSYEPSVSLLIKKAKNWRKGCILLYGGEPTLRKDLFEIIEKIKRIGLGVNLLTNGLNLNKEFIKKLEKSKLDRVQLQFDSLDDNINESMRKRKLLKQKLTAIENLKNTNINLTLFVVVVKDANENQIDKIISFAGKNFEKIKTVIFTPVSPEYGNRFKIKTITNGEIMEIIEKKYGITKEDFVICTEFDVTLSNFLYKIRNIKRRSLAPCEALCYIFIEGSKLIPLNDLIELKKLSEIFNNIIDSNEKDKIKIIISLFYQVLKKRVKINKKLAPVLFQIILSTINSFISKRPIKDKFYRSFGIIVNTSQDRYNIDYYFIKKCNLYSDTNEGNFIPFCEKNIFS